MAGRNVVGGGGGGKQATKGVAPFSGGRNPLSAARIRDASNMHGHSARTQPALVLEKCKTEITVDMLGLKHVLNSVWSLI